MKLASAKLAVDRAVGTSLVLLFSVLVLAVLWQVFSRYILGAPASFTDELARFSFMWLALLGAAYAGGQGGHLAIDLFSESLSEATRGFQRVVVLVLSLSFTGALVVGGSLLVRTSLALGQTSPVLGVPLGAIYSVVPLSGALLSFYLLHGALVRAEELTS